MNRRTFLKTTSIAAAASPMLNEKAFAASGEPNIQHVVLVMMENRSFDHLLGWLPKANGVQAGLSFPNKSGGTNTTHELAPDFTGCSYPDPDHSYTGGRIEVNGGKMNGFLMTNNGLNAIGYYREQDLPFRSAFARNYTTCDMYFPSILGPTFPNRIFQHAGQTDRLGDSFEICTLPTIWDRLAAAGVSHKYYFSNLPFLALWGLKYAGITALYADFLSDCASGKLPAVSFVEPTFTTLDNLDEDDHPFSDVRNGDAFLAKTFKAVSSSPNWRNTVFIVNYDEWGGFYDHVKPPRAMAPNKVDTDLDDTGKALLGCRVPCIVASPWTLGDKGDPTVNHTVFDHTSVLKLIESVWKVEPLAARETSSDVGNLLDVLGTSYDTTVPELPNPGYVFPSRFCFSNVPFVTSAVVPQVNLGSATRPDDEATTFAKMIQSGMLKGFPGYL